jgi:hypothetical protein
MNGYPALEGPISFGKNGDALKPVYIFEMHGGAWNLIGTHPAGSYAGQGSSSSACSEEDE